MGASPTPAAWDHSITILTRCAPGWRSASAQRRKRVRPSRRPRRLPSHNGVLFVSLELEAAANFADDFFRRDADVNDYGIRRFFEVGELTAENLLVGEMAFARSQAFRD